MTDIFFITYEFPPLNSGGVFRPLKFVKYFNEFGIKPIIFTLCPNDFSSIYKNKVPDYSLLKEIENVNKDIIYVKNKKALNTQKNTLISRVQIFFNIIDDKSENWGKNFFIETEKALQKYSPKVILVTAPPFGIIKLAVKLSKKTKIPLIIDMRDSFSMWVSHPYKSYLHYKLTLIKERHWFKQAKVVLAVTQQMINDWKFVHKKLSGINFDVISNGYDKKISFAELILAPNKEKFIIGYVGSFYYHPYSRDLMFKPWYKKRFHRKLQYTPRKEDWLYRSPYFLFKTLNLLFKKKPEYKHKVFIRFAGLKPPWFDNMVSDFNLENNVIHFGFLPFDEAIKFQKQCDALLLTSTKVIEGEDYCIAGKSFDYIAIEKPVIGFVTKGAQKEFIEKSGVGIICNPDNIEQSSVILNDLFEKGVKLKPNKEFIEKHHRKSLTKKLSKIILSG